VIGEKTDVCLWRIEPPPDADTNVEVNLQPRLHVAFGERARVTDLYAARDFIRDEIVAPLEAEIS
jgi:hypothetical protein